MKRRLCARVGSLAHERVALTFTRNRNTVRAPKLPGNEISENCKASTWRVRRLFRFATLPRRWKCSRKPLTKQSTRTGKKILIFFRSQNFIIRHVREMSSGGVEILHFFDIESHSHSTGGNRQVVCETGSLFLSRLISLSLTLSPSHSWPAWHTETILLVCVQSYVTVLISSF